MVNYKDTRFQTIIHPNEVNNEEKFDYENTKFNVAFGLMYSELNNTVRNFEKYGHWDVQLMTIVRLKQK